MAEESTLIMDAKLAESTERYDDMAECMKNFVNDDQQQLSPEQRNLLSVAYKNVVGVKRSSWRIVSSLEQKSEDDKEKEELKNYREIIEGELKKVCEEVFDIITKLIEANPESEAHIFYLKMEGDYYRYLCEVTTSDRDKVVKKSSAAYKAASDKAKEELPSTHPIRLGLALNYSVFHYEIENETEEACKLAKEAFDNAISNMEELQEDSYKDSTLIMQLLRDNLTLWTSETTDETQEGE